MTNCWLLLLTDDPLIATTTARLAESVGVQVRSHDEPAGIGPPGLVLVGADRPPEAALPAAAAGVPRLLVAVGEPEERFWRAALELRAEQVVLLPEAEQNLLDRLTRLVARPGRRALVIAVVGGCGGAGASVLACALARTAVGPARSLLIEVDRMGSGADLLLGAEDEPGLRWPDLASVRGRLLPGNLVGGVPVIDGLHVLSWDRSPDPIDLPTEAAAAVFDAAVLEFGVVVLDLPRQLDAVALAALDAADLALLVVPAEVRATAAARRMLSLILPRVADVRLVVRHAGVTGLSPEFVAAVLGLPLSGVLRPEPGLRVALSRGEPPGLRVRAPLSTLCRQLLADELARHGLDREHAPARAVAAR